MASRRIGRRAAAGVLTLATAGLVGLGAASFATASTGSAHEHQAVHAQHLTTAAAKRALHDGMRQLWSDHVTWTRLFIVSFVADLPDLQATTERLLQNQVDIGDAVKPFYGEAAGDRLTDLLTDHILTAAEVLAAAKTGDDAAFAEASDAWYANARQIARFLHRANPDNWPLAEMRSMMKEHLDLTLTEAAQQLGGDYAGSVATFDEVEASILHMADQLSAGIVAQFPGEF
jgi:hypothetical protein